MEKTAKIFSRLLFAVMTCAALLIGCFCAVLPDSVSVEAGTDCEVSLYGARLCGEGAEACYYLGALPIKTAAVSVVERPMLVPCGTPFGIKLRTDGVMAISVTDGSPAQSAGIKQGDVIISVNDVRVRSNSDISDAIQLSPDSCEVILHRGDSERLLRMEPYEDCGIYKIGVWVRDSAAGIGTMSYFDPVTGEYGGLGHSVSDVTTGELMPLLSGEITAADINGIVRGEAGAPGELCGRIVPNDNIGTIEHNTDCGIFGTVSESPCDGEAVPMAFRQEVKTGAATMLTTIDGCTPREYDIVIEHINVCDMESSKSMVIRITDPELLSQTGGIICGMSGSPILQDGRLVGAVTHVFLNDPERGYAIFCETMLDEAG